MRRFIYIVFIGALFCSCKKNASNCTKDKYAYEFYSSSRIDTISNDFGLFYQVNSGNDLVFMYSHTGPECEDFIDEEYVDKLVFKVPAGVNSFYYQNDQLTDATCLFRKISWWTGGAIRIKSGYVKGTKISATKWDVEINIDTGTSFGKIVLKKNFILH